MDRAALPALPVPEGRPQRRSACGHRCTRRRRV